MTDELKQEIKEVLIKLRDSLSQDAKDLEDAAN